MCVCVYGRTYAYVFTHTEACYSLFAPPLSLVVGEQKPQFLQSLF